MTARCLSAVKGRLHTVDTSSDADHIADQFRGKGGDLRFRITYAGELKAGAKKPRLEEKDAVRRYVSPQLAELRTRHPVFRAYGLSYTPPASGPAPNVGYAFSEFRTSIESYHHRPRHVDVIDGKRDVGHLLSEIVEVQGRNYLPLVRNNLALTCALDILFLRKGGEGALIAEGGDLDNRIKTLFDGLRMPKPGEIQPPSASDEVEAVTHCLLEDDSLITDFAVTTDRLLTHPGAKESEVLLVIDVVVRVAHLTSHNLGFLSE